ncbi:heterokaryon incompatibility protein, partial [Colletotrichum salicis]
YKALSYVWGDPSDTIALHVDNHVLHATKNLHSALQPIRLFLKPSRLVPLWIDAISINQIYNSADLVLTWLGPDFGPGLTYLRELGEHALAVSRKSKEPPEAFTQPRQRPVCNYQRNRQGLSIYLLEPRLDGTGVQCPKRPLRYGVLRDGLRRRGGADASFVDATISRVKKVSHDLKMSYARMAASNETDTASDGVKAFSKVEQVHQIESKNGRGSVVHHFNLISLLLRFRDLQATDPRDRIYTPLNLLDHDSREKPIIPVDYSLTIQQLYTSLARRLVEDNDYWPLSILEICRYGSSHLPSWVPDWQVLPRKIMTVQINVVAEVWEAFDAMSVPRAKSYPTYKLKTPSEKYAIGGQTVLEAFRELAGIEPRSEYGEEVEVYRQEDWHRNQGMMSHFNRRRLISTENGLVGLAPAEAIKGDKVWLVHGANMFYIFRPVTDNGSHVLLGEVYLQDLMNGEAREFSGGTGNQTVITLV